MPDPNQNDLKTQNLSIFLIKEDFKSSDQIITDNPRIKEHTIEVDGVAVGQLFVQRIPPKPPRWACFFDGCIDVSEIGNVATTSAVLLVENNGRMFAITFGHGRYLLKTDCWEERFGLRVTLNCIDENKVRCIDKKTFDAITKQSKEQASRDALPQDFGLDIEQDLLRAVTGKPVRELHGARMSGMDSLHVAIKAEISDVSDLLSEYYVKFNDDTYKKTFPWVDHIAEVKSKGLIADLDKNLADHVRDGKHQKIWLSVPEIIDWDDVSGFRYSLRANKPEFSDIHLDKFIESLDDNADINIDLLKARRIHCISNEGFEKYKWTAYKCLYGEISLNSKIYLLSGGKWYIVDTDYVQTVNDSFRTTPQYEKTLPGYDHMSETEYNSRVASLSPNDYALMDRKFIYHGGGQSKFEFCDLYTLKKDIIHVKRYGGSSVLSHLFAQGLNSAELFQTDPEFRQKVNAKLPEAYQIPDPLKRPEYGEYRVVYAIVSDIDGDLELPFFSKLSLKNARRRMEGFGYKVALSKINVDDEIRKKQIIRTRIKNKL